MLWGSNKILNNGDFLPHVYVYVQANILSRLEIVLTFILLLFIDIDI